ncbi:MAG: hypothetical protein HY553_17390 [Elusimicrobia bacterium]|nr:hypothetical protein [Elusimicrobiota bacterium]
MNIRYRFVLDTGEEKRFELKLDGTTLAIQNPAPEPPPAWTRLGNEQCPNCPLAEASSPHCPVALKLVDVIEQFKAGISFQEAEISISTRGREYRKRAPLQTGISSLIGVVMVTSGCPILDKLRPMVCTHLPFADASETMYRAISMYLMAQYFVKKRGAAPDWELRDLVKIYDEVSTVNRQFARRLRTVEIEDASLNALVSLDCFAAFAVGAIVDDALDHLENLFHAYLPAPVRRN